MITKEIKKFTFNDKDNVRYLQTPRLKQASVLLTQKNIL